MKFDTPDKTKADYLLAVVRAGIGSVPVAGAAATELFNSIVTPPLEKRRQKWMADVGECLQRLEENKTTSIEELQLNPIFLDTVFQASQAAIKTSAESKLIALRNAIINAALPHSPDASLQQMFISFIDNLSELHLRILALCGKKGLLVHYFNKNEAEEALAKTIESFFPELVGKKYFYMQVFRDLANRGLVPEQPQIISNAFEYGGITEFGEQFLSFMKNNEID